MGRKKQAPGKLPGQEPEQPELKSVDIKDLPTKDRLRALQLYALDEDLREIANEMPEMTTQCVQLQAARSANRLVNAAIRV